MHHVHGPVELEWANVDQLAGAPVMIRVRVLTNPVFDFFHQPLGRQPGQTTTRRLLFVARHRKSNVRTFATVFARVSANVPARKRGCERRSVEARILQKNVNISKRMPLRPRAHASTPTRSRQRTSVMATV